MMQYITLLNVSIVFIILAILVYHEHINGAVVLFLITTIPLIAFPFLWTLSIYRRQEKKRQDVMKGKWK
jgi:O-antigen/teichoic acid export membrane protein